MIDFNYNKVNKKYDNLIKYYTVVRNNRLRVVRNTRLTNSTSLEN